MKKKVIVAIVAILAVLAMMLFILVTLRDTDVAQYSNLSNQFSEYEDMTVTLILEDGNELECKVITIFEVEKQEYMALFPEEDTKIEKGEIYLYRYSEDAEGNPSLDNIEDDNEYEIVADAFDKLLDTPS